MLLTLKQYEPDIARPDFSVSKELWPESFGNHRALIEVSDSAEVVLLDMFWRRHDPDPGKKRFIIVEASTGDTVPNVYRFTVTRERCRIAFGPVKKRGIYYFYYMPYEVQEDWGFYGKDYLKPGEGPSADWLEKNRINKTSGTRSFPRAAFVELQARTAFDSFYPMEVIPLSYEKKIFLSKFTDDYLVFPEDRAFPVRMRDEIPLKWIETGPLKKFRAEAFRNEYFAFQLGIYASRSDLQNIKLSFTNLKNRKNVIPASALTCFNLGGIDPYGNPFEKRLDLAMGKVQPLWIGIDIPESTPPGTYTGTVTVQPENMKAWKVEVSINVNEKMLPDRGDSETWRHSRLRWLNSTIGLEDNHVKPYDPIEFIQENTVRLTNKTVRITQNGMPASIRINNKEILAGAVSFSVETERGIEKFLPPDEKAILKNAPGVMSASWKSRSGVIEMNGTGTVESDGYINYKIRLNALNDITVNDVRLEIPFSPSAGRYVMGLGLPGAAVPRDIESKWSGPWDSFWIGNADGGLWCELRGGSYHGPLLNLYRPAFPSSWHNEGKGGYRLNSQPDAVRAVVYSGSRELKRGEFLDFEWSFLITPVKTVNSESQFTDRYYHNGGNPMPSDEDLVCGVKIVNLHHANNYNPHINYPFIAVDSMRWFVNRMHEKGLKVKIYYTIRELTNYTTELWALRSLGNEILGTGDGGGYPWLREHLINDYRPQWYQHFPDKSPDASIVNAPGDSRWYNYYIEGLAWLVRNVDIDGLYLDDVTYDRRIVKRMRKVLDREKPGCIIDLHSNTAFSKGPAMQYAEYFPYIDKLWFGESFRYDLMTPENWFVEVSGIPFGLMGDMLQGGGNRWRGMVYGMTVRHPWVSETIKSDPRPVWEIWDTFGIESSVMKGYWQEDCPVSSNIPEVKTTIYVKPEKSLISLASWADEPVNVSLVIDWKALGIDPSTAVLKAPLIRDFQEEKTFGPGDKIPVDPGRGWLLIIAEGK